ncbi:receptor-like protein EIX2 [Alnus glutinosa]|uniref:receptor-like protein EIX2 n=1 Tax=Alnus glutinosa TaxID=3517 RepID=UPI002D78BA59|nr:receptor-like protein EIX2 [Alnus glutinosa]
MVDTHVFLSTFHLILIFFLSLLGNASYLQLIKPASCTKSPIFKCSEVEREALLSFKDNLKDPSGRLSSWVGDDCCNWTGVGCDNITGQANVVKLDLKSPFDEENNLCLEGKISPSLLNLKHLSYLDLSLNNFSGNTIPNFLGSIESLRYLNLSFSMFAGVIPPHLGNLSRLEYLDLQTYSFVTQQVIPYPGLNLLEAKSLEWFAGFPSLRYLNLGFINLTKVPDWLDAVNMLPFLVELHLAGCGLVSLPHSISSVNFTVLSVIDLSYNNFNSSIPHWLSNVSGLSTINLASNYYIGGDIPIGLGHLTNLRILDLGGNNLIGMIPSSFSNLCNLQTLDLQTNNIIGMIPSSFSNLCNLQTLNLQYNNISGEITELVDGLSQCSNSSLEYLDLSYNYFLGGNLPSSLGGLNKLQALDLSGNQMIGTIPKSIGKLSMLVSLNLDWKSLKGVLTEAHFQNLTRLKSLQLSTELSANQTLVLDVKKDWVPPFKLADIFLRNVWIGPNFPAWLKTQNELKDLQINNAGISDTIPHGLWKCFPNVTFWSLSGNELRGQVPYFQFHPRAYHFDLSSNKLEGPLPLFPGNFSALSLDNNMFSGPIPENIGELLPNLKSLDLSSNSIIGKIPHSIGMLKELDFLWLQNNSLSGKLPPYWKDLDQLLVLDLAKNNISGNVPSSMRHLRSLEVLSLSQNNLEGELPSFFRNYRFLQSLDLRGNKFSGKLPAWIGKSQPYFLMLNLRSNLFHGDIPQQLCNLSQLRILDLAHNYFSGAIPQCLGNLCRDDIYQYDYDTQISLVAKGRDYLYDRSVYGIIYSVDLSHNNLSGEIPDSITSLLRLVSLNLSMNHLTGRIPERIGTLDQLQSLDLSMNELYGPIPESLSSLTFLSHLNLSFNNLSGKIPNGNQLQTLYDDDSSIYEGNSLLCGPPLSTKCSEDETKPRVAKENGRGIESISFYISMVAGFIVGFWGVCGTLIIRTSWRHAYFRSFDNLKDKIAVFVMVKIVRLLRKVK